MDRTSKVNMAFSMRLKSYALRIGFYVYTATVRDAQ
jgi:hypothetical protein